jgi:hypothetical protein
MEIDTAGPNQGVTDQEQDARQRVESSVDGWQVVNRHSWFAIIAIQSNGR